MDILPYLKLMVEKNASDLFFTVGAPVKIKIEGKAQSVGKTMLTGDVCKAAAYGVMSKHQVAKFEETMECDFAIPLPDGGARFRVNVFRQRGDVAMVMRRIPQNIPSCDSLGLPEIVKELIMHKRGLILMVGATGSGKSTTLAAMIDHRNDNMLGHILTIEDPVEFSHPNKKSIGEIRERETMEAALELSNTGHLAISTLHANNSNQAMERVINLFPQESHKQLFMDLSLNLRAVISQRLVLGVDGKRCAAIEIMLNTPHIAELILKGEIHEVKEAMAESGAGGMQTFDTALFNLYKEGRITLEEALANADSRTNLEARINFG
jgi:twitching motility protein PilU